MTKEWIPNINIGQDYDIAYQDATIHFDVLGKMADFFGRDMPMHLHADYCQIHLILSGNTLFNIDQNVFQTDSGGAFYTPPATPHAFLTEPTAPGYVITIHSTHLQKIFSELNSYSNLNALLMPFHLDRQKGAGPNTSSWGELVNLFDMLKTEWYRDSQYKLDSIEAIVKLIMITMLRLSGYEQPKKQHSQTEILCFRHFSTLLETHFLTAKHISFYCNELNINESRLNYLCKKITGISPKKMINGRILLEAKRLLSHTNKNTNEIAYTLGYLDPSYFSRFFVKNTGMSPTSFRQQNQAS
ncbi:helix-turn-helix domain-containing protein [Marinomonas sp. A79]|uniref:Helix-turn-helix domain-containing protein n=1 Tax=Marinomonas vulgaris TaxID=2823372 RepID=A0ABS5HEJ0_9GAMM|nr:helix-turn-helix domain-containing protein [Marinomonas vulgaris]MBR7890048.1 helix-turn-helix domain-containing protein [Marinomonas vulgaris]